MEKNFGICNDKELDEILEDEYFEEYFDNEYSLLDNLIDNDIDYFGLDLDKKIKKCKHGLIKWKLLYLISIFETIGAELLQITVIDRDIKANRLGTNSYNIFFLFCMIYGLFLNKISELNIYSNNIILDTAIDEKNNEKVLSKKIK